MFWYLKVLLCYWNGCGDPKIYQQTCNIDNWFFANSSRIVTRNAREYTALVQSTYTESKGGGVVLDFKKKVSIIR